METKTIIGSDVAYAADLLESGEVVAFPTETVYGLGANALNTNAVQKIFTIKSRPASNPLIVHVATFEQAIRLTANVPDAALKLIEKLTPGALTLLLPKSDLVPNIVTAGLPDVAIRIPDHPLAMSLLRETGFPLAAPSANPYGYISPTTASHVYKMLAGRIKYILDGGVCLSGIESTIIGFPNGSPTIFREGIITKEQIEEVVGQVYLHNSIKQLTPGMSLSHYCPNTPLILSEDVEAEIAKHKLSEIGLITYNNYSASLPLKHQLLLCSGSDFKAAAKNIYAAMHEMDERRYNIIIVKKLPNIGIAMAINDRLQRASKK